MTEFNLVTPTLLFSAISVIVLAYTNRFLSYAQLVRGLKDKYQEDRAEVTAAQIINLYKRLRLTRAMQILGLASLLLSCVSMFLFYVGIETVAVWVFGVALLLLIASLALSVREVLISTHALELYLKDMSRRR